MTLNTPSAILFRAGAKPDRNIVAVRDLEPRPVGGACAGNIQAAARLRDHKAALLSPAPLLSACAVPKLDRRSIGGRAAGAASRRVSQLDQNTWVTWVPESTREKIGFAWAEGCKGSVFFIHGGSAAPGPVAN